MSKKQKKSDAKKAAKKTVKKAAKKTASKKTAEKASKAKKTAKKAAPGKPVPSHTTVASRAYAIWQNRQRFGIPGNAYSDWLEAERELS